MQEIIANAVAAFLLHNSVVFCWWEEEVENLFGPWYHRYATTARP